MAFTVQRHVSSGPTANQGDWAIVLDHEHIMFVGSYRQCEDWLDFHDLVATTFGPKSPEDPPKVNRSMCNRIKRLFQSIASWYRGQPSQTSAAQKTQRNSGRNPVVRLLRDNAGQADELSIIAAAVLVGGLYIGSMLISLTVTWSHIVSYGNMLRLPSSTYASTGIRSDARSKYDSESAEIACDLTTTGR